MMIILFILIILIMPIIIFWELYGPLIGFLGLMIALLLCYGIYKLMIADSDDENTSRRSKSSFDYVDFSRSDDSSNYGYSDSSSDSGGGGGGE